LDLDADWGGEWGGPGIGVFDVGPHAPREGEVLVFFLPIGLNGVFECIFKTELYRLVHEKLAIFSYRQYINGIMIYSF